MKKIVIYAPLVFVLFFCTKKDPNDPPLTTAKWALKSLISNSSGNKTDKPSDVNNEIIQFIDSIGVIEIGGCVNGCQGHFKTSSTDSIKIFNLTCTDRASNILDCSNWDEYFFNTLESAKTFTIVGNILTLKCSGTYSAVLEAQ